MTKAKQQPTSATVKITLGKSNPKTAKPASSAPRSKQHVMIDLLKRRTGATLEELMKATGWQRHSVRGTLSGVIKKRLKLALTSAQESRGLVYRIDA